MTVPTRSNKSELHGLLPNPTQARGKTAPRTDQEDEVHDLNPQGRCSSDPGEGCWKEIAMDLDPAPSASSAATPARPIIPAIPARPSTPKISELLEKEQTKLRVKKHVDIWKECLKEALLSATPTLQSLLTKAQESQKALQKLIPNDKIKGFVKGWNPWTKKKKFFPAPPKTNKGKRRSSNSINFKNPHKWRKIADMLKIAEGLYNNME
ncbi:hypothetical protein PTTG_10337 [Puccinia triticina 1-1 BBBD Race 1]|uniref:Uncharacterized protein n=1 Tax=Puccinia triticina (isolate 1-1 / race 1 (BBBD)) TaxID=630390 RepID=A0A180G3H5_PUCT1|nr:hypothetical protein PTTG_10337 [Puccinia triticina 1-1 BBBD Race 1]